MAKFKSIKKYDHTEGFSCCFRQWRAQSHCSKLHGYALAFEFVFESEKLDIRNWVVDFGGLKELKNDLKYWFDHTTLVSHSDPELKIFEELNKLEIIDLRILPHVGCEKVCEFVWSLGNKILKVNNLDQDVRLKSVQVWEHPGNSAMYEV